MLTIASGNAFEVEEYALLLSKDLGFISIEDFDAISPKAKELKMKYQNLS